MMIDSRCIRRISANLLLLLGSLAILSGATQVYRSNDGLQQVSNNLLAGSRRLEEDADDSYAADDTFEYNDLSQYSLRFEKCQLVRMFDDDLAADEDSSSPLATKHFVVYRLCPSDVCEGSCNENYGTYVVEVDTYLAYTIDYQTQAFETMCNNCDEKCNDDGSYCSGCGLLCYNYENLEANGYVDASAYIECQQLDYGDDDGLQLYVGPMCSSSGQKIAIGLFSDENCWEPYTALEVEDVIGAKLSYHLISHASTEDGSVCLSCMESGDENDNDQDQEDLDEVNEMCEDLYLAAAKCESKTGLQGGFIQTNVEDYDYENQVENEFMSCTFIESLIYNSYTEAGEIDIFSDQDEIIRKATPVQTLTLSLLLGSIVGLTATIVYIHHRIDTQFPNVNSFRANPSGMFA